MLEWHGKRPRKSKKGEARSLVVLTLFFLLAAVCAFSGQANTEYENFVEHVVQPGETIWGISRQYHPGPEVNRQEIVHLIRKVNNIDPLIFPGQKILVPIKSGD